MTLLARLRDVATQMPPRASLDCYQGWISNFLRDSRDDCAVATPGDLYPGLT